MRIEREFRVTMIDNASLLQRLSQETGYFFQQLKLAWPQLRDDPIGAGRHILSEVGVELRRAGEKNSLTALATAVLLLLSAALFVVWVGNSSKENYLVQDDGAETVQIIELQPNQNATSKDHGVGAGSKGRVGFAAGRGEGSAREVRKASGGGGGGQHDPLPTQVGKLPQPSEIPAPIPKSPPLKNPELPAAGIDIDPALWKNLPLAVYGDPRSQSTVPSNGPGAGGGMGTTNGTGIGEGIGPGVGPGQDGNMGGGRKGLGNDAIGGGRGNDPEDPDHIYPPQQVTERARVLAKPEPQYTEEARRNSISGSVVLRVVFSRSGEVINIRAVQTLPFGLTERAIAAARMIRFRPATKDGRPVNVPMQLEYNFNLY
jgi:TonB family protein